jgi:hypothetical protein
MILMQWTDKANAQDTELGQKVDLGDHYFLWTDTKDYFPTLKMDDNYIPFGNSKPMCLHLTWAKREMRRMVDMYKVVGGLTDCENALNKKYRWQQDDPKTGIDVRPYI